MDSLALHLVSIVTSWVCFAAHVCFWASSYAMPSIVSASYCSSSTAVAWCAAGFLIGDLAQSYWAQGQWPLTGTNQAECAAATLPEAGGGQGQFQCVVITILALLGAAVAAFGFSAAFNGCPHRSHMRDAHRSEGLTTASVKSDFPQSVFQ